jgi:hypothetical protein
MYDLILILVVLASSGMMYYKLSRILVELRRIGGDRSAAAADEINTIVRRVAHSKTAGAEYVPDLDDGYVGAFGPPEGDFT